MTLIDKAEALALIAAQMKDARRTYEGFGHAQEALRFAEQMLTAVIAALPARGVEVKPLVWVPDGTDSLFGKGLFNYRAKHFMDGHWTWSRFNSGTWYLSSGPLDGDLYTEETAKAAAQADYEARILAALAPTDAIRCAECDCDDGNCTWIKAHIEPDAPTDAAQAEDSYPYDGPEQCERDLEDTAAQAREAAWREVAELVRGWRNDVPMTGEECANAILALIGEART